MFFFGVIHSKYNFFCYNACSVMWISSTRIGVEGDDIDMESQKVLMFFAMSNSSRMQSILKKLKPASHGRMQYCAWCPFILLSLEADYVQKKLD